MSGLADFKYSSLKIKNIYMVLHRYVLFPLFKKLSAFNAELLCN